MKKNGLAFYPTTIPDIQQKYKLRDLSAKGVLKFYFQIRLESGWKLRISPKELRELFQMSRTTFWRAINELREEEFINYEDPENLMITLLPQPSQNWDGHPKNGTDIPKMGRTSQKWDSTEEKTASGKDSSELIDMENTSTKLSNSKNIYEPSEQKKEVPHSCQQLDQEETDSNHKRLDCLAKWPKKFSQNDKEFLDRELQPFREIWNQYKYPTWAKCEKLNESRVKNLLAFYKEEGTDSLALFERAVKQMSSESYYQQFSASIDLLIRKTKGKIRAFAEKYKETSSGQQITEGNINDALHQQKAFEKAEKIRQALKSGGDNA